MIKQNAIILLLVRGVFLHVQFFSSYYGVDIHLITTVLGGITILIYIYMIIN